MNEKANNQMIPAKLLLFVILIGIGVGIGVYLFSGYLKDAKEAEYYRENGGQTTATVTKAHNYWQSSGVKHRSLRDYSDFTIKYTVGGKKYTKEYIRESGTYTEGETVTVYYLNSNPNGELRFHLEQSVVPYIILGVGPSLIGVIGLIVTFVQYKRSKQY